MKKCTCKICVNTKKMLEIKKKLKKGYNLNLYFEASRCVSGASLFCPCGLRSLVVSNVVKTLQE